MPRRRLLCGGKLDHVHCASENCASEIGTPGAVVNLRRGPDREARLFGAEALHLLTADDVENNETRHPAVRRWLNRVMHAVADPGLRLPLLLHCTSGKDRTGVVTATLLAVLGIERGLIVEEDLLTC